MPKRILFFGLPLLFLLVQAVPYGRDHRNPPPVREPGWDSPATRALAKRACFDCHSNETAWPAYSLVAPVSWLVYRDVSEGRAELNFSDWRADGRDSGAAGRIGKALREGGMPPLPYRLLHPEARLSTPEREALARGMAASAAAGR